MNGAQDVGGMMNFGPVIPEPESIRFHAEWEKRALGITLAAGAMGVWNLDITRSARESLPPAEYLSSSYYEIWISALSRQLVVEGLVTEEELSDGVARIPAKPVPRILTAEMVGPVLKAGTHYNRKPEAPARFAVGDQVRTRVMNPWHHTRIPQYAKGKMGVVDKVHDVFVFPDTNAHRKGEHPQWVYTVRFDAQELWGSDADKTVTVSIEVWESYLE